MAKTTIAREKGVAPTYPNLEDNIRSGFWSLVPPEVRPLAPIIRSLDERIAFLEQRLVKLEEPKPSWWERLKRQFS
jgi:hypothetical protein